MKEMTFNAQHCLNFIEHNIDYVQVTPDVEIMDAEVVKVVASDHRPHAAVLRL